MWIVVGVVLWMAIAIFAVALCNAAAQDPGSLRSGADRDDVVARPAIAARPVAGAVEDLRGDPAPISA